MFMFSANSFVNKVKQTVFCRQSVSVTVNFVEPQKITKICRIMSFSAQIPGSTKHSFTMEMRKDPKSTRVIQSSCHSFVEKSSAITNPLCFQHDVVYPNVAAALSASRENEDNQENVETERRTDPVGCKGHQLDNDFPLESKMPTAVPIVMYPSKTGGRKLGEVDMCALPVLNWEKYIFDVRNYQGVWRHRRERLTTSIDNEKTTNAPLTDILEHGEDLEADDIDNEDDDSSMKVSNKNIISGEQEDEAENDNTENKPQKKKTMRFRSVKDTLLLPSTVMRLKHQPKLKVEGTWNYLFGGNNGACCFMKTGSIHKGSKKLQLFVGAGSQLRAVKLSDSSPHSMLSSSVASVWQEKPAAEPFNRFAKDSSPFNDQIFQIVPNEHSGVIGVRRGKSVQIYDVEKDVPILLESVPNKWYHTHEWNPRKATKRIDSISDPLLLGIDFNPIYSPEIVTIDENMTVRICNVFKQTTCDMYSLPHSDSFINKHKGPILAAGYPELRLNLAAGATFANFGQLIYAWGQSMVYLTDRRDMRVSRSHVMPLFNIRSHRYMHSVTDQNWFGGNSAADINEYVSCIRRCNDDPYYYVGTSSKIYLMDLRVPIHPVIKVSHGLQSPLAYMDTVSDENFDILVGGSQRLSETICMITDRGHVNCVKRLGCKLKNPVLNCYPRHLSNSRAFFDSAINQGFDFPFPADHEMVRSHHYAWSSGLAVFPLAKRDPKLPIGIMVATSNNFGDVFWQEWDQKPLPSHRRIRLKDYKFQSALQQWHKSLTTADIMKLEKPKPSINPFKPVDCSLFLESAAVEIPALPKVRTSRFNCFKPNQLQFIKESKNTHTIDHLELNLRKYKDARVKNILKLWIKEKESTAITEQPIEIKVEPTDFYGRYSPSSSVQIMDVDISDEESISTTKKHKSSSDTPRVKLVSSAAMVSECDRMDFEEPFESSQTQPNPTVTLDTDDNYPMEVQSSNYFPFISNDMEPFPVPHTSLRQPLRQSSQKSSGSQRKSGFL